MTQNDKAFTCFLQKQSSRGVLVKDVLKICTSVALQLYWNHTSAWVFPCKFAAYFQNFFLRTPLGGCFCSFKVTVRIFISDRSRLSQMFFKIGVLKNFGNINRKTPVSEPLFNKVADLKGKTSESRASTCS